MKRILGVLLAGVLLLSGCGQWQKSQKESAYHLYCLDKTGTTLVQEPYEPKEGTDQKLIKELVDALQEKPARDGNQALLSNGISIKTFTLENGLLTLNLSGEYGELARPQEVLVRAGLVRTFVQVPEVERVTLLIDGDPLKDSKGREIGTMTADSFLENSGREIYQYQYATLTLYFANEAGDHLVKETRRVPYSTNIPQERVEVEQLKKEGYVPQRLYNRDPVLHRCLDALRTGFRDGVRYDDLYQRLLFGAGGSPADEYFLLADFQAYCQAEKRMAEIAVLRTHIINYAKTRETYVAYRKAGYSRKFREEHEEEILLHQAAKNAFDEMGVKKLPKVKDLQAEYAKLLEEKKKTYAEYRHSREEMRELLTAKANVERLLKMDEEQKKEQEKGHGQR